MLVARYAFIAARPDWLHTPFRPCAAVPAVTVLGNYNIAPWNVTAATWTDTSAKVGW
jgi:hypothetical protein